MTNPPIEFRYEVRPDDWDTVRRLVDSTGVFSAVEIDTAVELVDDRLKRAGERLPFRVRRRGRPHGRLHVLRPIALTEASFDLYWIAVDKSMHGRKVGRALLEGTEEFIRGAAAGKCTSKPPTATTTPPPAVFLSGLPATRRKSY